MREIKFRAWVPSRQQMQNVAAIGFANKKVVLYFGDYWHEQATLTMDLEEVEVTQYTGLDDALGHQIYEGDILQDPDDSRFCYEVEYDYGRFSCGDNDLIDCLGCNVVGNVFENPELLEETE